MAKYRYWSKSNNRFINIYAVIGNHEVALLYDDLVEFKTMKMFEWLRAIESGDIVEGWEE